MKKISGLNEIYELTNDEIQSYSSIKTTSNQVDAYERLLLESMKGIQSLFVCREEVEEAWKWIDPIIEAWKKTADNSLKLYAAGTWGPKNSDEMIIQDGRCWHQFN